MAKVTKWHNLDLKHIHNDIAFMTKVAAAVLIEQRVHKVHTSLIYEHLKWNLLLNEMITGFNEITAVCSSLLG